MSWQDKETLSFPAMIYISISFYFLYVVFVASKVSHHFWAIQDDLHFFFFRRYTSVILHETKITKNHLSIRWQPTVCMMIMTTNAGASFFFGDFSYRQFKCWQFDGAQGRANE